MRDFDLSPLYRSAIGFDRMAGLLDSINRSEQPHQTYPPYNIEVTGDDNYRITMAISGFNEADLVLEVKPNLLTVSGKKESEKEPRKFLHQGIAARNFERRFQIADYVRVESAQLEDGLLHIDLVREIPEAMKPRTIPVLNVKTGNIHDPLLRSVSSNEEELKTHVA